MLSQQLRRLKGCERADEIVIATTTNPSDDPIEAVANSEGVRWFRGSERDVLARYVAAAREAQADIVIRVTADCPLIDSAVVDQVIAELEQHSHLADYASNVAQRTFPQGLDAEAMFLDTLVRVDRMAQSDHCREHVTIFIYKEHPELFLIRQVKDSENNSDLRWTVDWQEDLELVRKIYGDLGLDTRCLPYREVVDYVRAHPDCLTSNLL